MTTMTDARREHLHRDGGGNADEDKIPSLESDAEEQRLYGCGSGAVRRILGDDVSR